MIAAAARATTAATDAAEVNNKPTRTGEDNVNDRRSLPFATRQLEVMLDRMDNAGRPSTRPNHRLLSRQRRSSRQRRRNRSVSWTSRSCRRVKFSATTKTEKRSPDPAARHSSSSILDVTHTRKSCHVKCRLALLDSPRRMPILS